MKNLPPAPPSHWQWRDGKLYYLGPVRNAEEVTFRVADRLSAEERTRAFNEWAESLTEYDFDSFKRNREMERGTPYEEVSE